MLAAMLWHDVQDDWKRRQAAGEAPFPALQAAIDAAFDARIGDISGRGKLAVDMREIWMLQPRFERRASNSALALLEQPRFRAGLDFLRLRGEVGEADPELAVWWEALFQADDEKRRDLLDSVRETRGPRRVKRERRARQRAGAMQPIRKARRAKRRNARRPATSPMPAIAAMKAASCPTPRRRASAGAGAGGLPIPLARRADLGRWSRRWRPPTPSDAFIGLGSNLGDRAAEIDRALAEIAALPATALVARSAHYASAPLDAPGGEYLNAVAHVRTALAPLDLLHALQAIESRHGRLRPFPGAPRTLDLDLLLYGDLVLASGELTLPHPRLHERAFVVSPLAEIAPQRLVPGRGRVIDLRAAVAAQRIAKLPR